MTGITRAMAARIIAGYFGTQATYVGGQYDAYSIRDSEDRQWKIVSDSPIRPESGRDTRPNQNYKVEFVSPICVYSDIETIQEIIRSLRAGGAKVNDSCGIHVHVDASRHNVKTLRNIVNIMAAKEDLLYKTLKVNVDRERYCQKADTRFLDELNSKRPMDMNQLETMWYNGTSGRNQHYNSTRYHACNLHSVFSKGTIVVGCNYSSSGATAMVDTGDVHALMIGAAGVGKTAYFLYPNLEYACASGMSFITSDTKGDLFRHYGKIAKEYYSYNVAVIDLRNPTKSDGNNLLHLVNKYMDLWKAEPNNLAYKAKAEKYAKIISKTIITSGMENSSFGQNAFFYDAAEGLLTSSILLVAEFCPPETRHIVSVLKIIQDLLAPSKTKGKSQFQILINQLPEEHKARGSDDLPLSA